MYTIGNEKYYELKPLKKFFKNINEVKNDLENNILGIRCKIKDLKFNDKKILFINIDLELLGC